MERKAGKRRAAMVLALALCALSPASGTDLQRDAVTLRAAYSRPIGEWPAPVLDRGVDFVELAPLETTLPSRGDVYPARLRRAVPAEGELATRAPEIRALGEQVLALGERLFADPTLSASGVLSCASCHDPGAGFTVRSPTAFGHGGAQGLRNPVALLDTPHRVSFGWDGGSTDLQERILAPFTDPGEMGNTSLAAVLDRIGDVPSYRMAFSMAFGATKPDAPSLARALIAYLEAQPRDNRFDRFLTGDTGALSDTEIEGLHLFRTKARCVNCHFGQRLTDDRFHNLRLSSFREPSEDLGRYGVTGRMTDIGRFQTPSLRQVANTAPYMHHGLIETLEGVVHFYNRGGGEVWARNAREASDPQYPHAAAISPHIRPLDLSPDERAALVAFLRTL